MSIMLYKNVIAALKKKWVQIIAIGLIIFLSSFIYTMMFYSISGLEEPTLNYLDKYKQEDFSVDMRNVLTPADILAASSGEPLPVTIYSLADLKSYSIVQFNLVIRNRMNDFLSAYPQTELELREFKEIYFDYKGDEHRGLIIRAASKINLSFIEEGRYPTGGNEIALTRTYAERNGLKPGDTLNLKGKDYTISGYVLFPDYTYPMIDNSFLVDNGKLTLFLGSDEVYAEISGKEGFRFAGIVKDGFRVETIRDNIKATIGSSQALFFVTRTVFTKNQMRSGAIFDELRSGKVFSLGFSIIIASIAILIVALLAYKVLHSERRQIGLLKSLGYRRREIAGPYLLFIVATALPMLVAGYIAGVFAAEPMKRLYQIYYLLPSTAINQNPIVFLTAILVPLLFFTGFSGVIISRMLSAQPLELLYPDRNETVNNITKAVSKLLTKAKSSTKFRYLYILKNSAKFIVFFIGIVLSTELILFSFMMNGMIDRMTIRSLESVGYRYESYVDAEKGLTDIKEGQEKFLLYPDASFDGNPVTAAGLETDNKLYNLYDAKGNNITHKIEDSFVVTRSLSIKHGLKTGDELDLIIGGIGYHSYIGGISDDFSADKIYLEIKKLSRYMSEDKSDSLYTGVYSLEKPSSDYYSVILDKEAIMDQAVLMEYFLKFSVYAMIIVSMLIAIIILFVLTSMTVEDNYYNISLLKVMGYSRKEVNAMVLDSYLIYTVFSYIASVPLAVMTLGWAMLYFARGYDMVLPLEFRLIHVIIGFILILLVFLAGTWNAKKKIEKISLQEILKVYTE